MSTSDPLTIAVPTRDRVAYLRECLQSILAQTFRDFRVVVLDNASSQDVRGAIAPLADGRVSLVRNDTPRDVIGSLNGALRVARTPYFMVFHDDDTMHPRLIETEMGLIAAEPRLAFVAAHCIEVREDAAMSVFDEIKPRYERYADVSELVRAFVRGSWLHLGSVIYDRRAAEGLTLDGERYWVLADRPFLAAVAGSRPTACLVGPWMHWRRHPGTSGSGLLARHVFALLDFYRGVLSRRWDRETRDLFLRFATDSVLGSYPRLVRSERPPLHRYVAEGIARGFLHPLAVRPAHLSGLGRVIVEDALRGRWRAPLARGPASPSAVPRSSRLRVRPDTFRRLIAASRRIGGPPADFLEFRKNQLDLVLTHARVPFAGTILELGGGVSGHAFLLTDLAEKVICTDLLEVGSSYGGKFAEAAAVATADPSGRLKYVCARGEAMPLRSASVDTVFCSYVFEHIADRPAAVAEIFRVLKPGGHAVINVPNRMEPIHRALGFYLGDVPRQVLKAALEWTGLRERLRVPIRVPPPPRPSSAAELRQWLRATFTYPPHGAYRHHLEELVESATGHWDRLFRQRGFVIERRFTLSLENHLAFLSPELTRGAQRLLLPLLYRFADSPVVVWIGDSYCFVARKPVSRSSARTGVPPSP